MAEQLQIFFLEAPFMVMGDFNDTWDSETMKTIVGEGSTALWSATSELRGELPDTYNRGENQSMIDFILCSPAMAKKRVAPTPVRLPRGL